jgi:RND family efflux transporter MFP subunit
MTRISTRYLFGLSLAALLALPLWGCGEKTGPAEVRRPEVTGVTVEAVETSEAPEFYEAQGTVRAKTSSAVSSRVMGSVKSVLVKEGDRVRKGQLLVVLDDRDIRARLKAAEEGYREAQGALESALAHRQLAEVTFGRYQSLYEQKALTEQEMDRIRTEKEVAQQAARRAEAALSRSRAGLEEAGAYLDFTRLKSPVNGVVTEKKIDAGSMAVPGQPLVVIEEPAYRMDVNVDESRVESISKGSEVDVEIPSLDRSVKGKVAEAVPAVEPSSRTFVVKIDLRDGSLRSGLYGKARFPVGRRKALLVPAGAVVRKGQLIGVYSVGENGVLSYRLIRVGRTYGEMVEVLSGISDGDRIVVAGVEHAADGGILKEASAR